MTPDLPDPETRDLVERFLDGTLTPEQSAELTARRNSDQALDRLIAGEEQLHAFVATGAAKTFRPLFEKRVMAQLAEVSTDNGMSSALSFPAAIARLFPRIALPSLSAACLLMAGNYSAAAADTPLLYALIGIPTQAFDLLLLL